MKSMELQKALSLIRNYFSPEEILFGKKTDEHFIKKAEELLEVLLPISYKEFLSLKGFGGVGSLLISGIREHQDLNDLAKTGVVWKNILNRKQMNQPKHLIYIDEVGEGTSYCLDTSQTRKDNECPVVEWPIGGYEMTPELKIIAPDFGTFFLNKVLDQIEAKKGIRPEI